MKPVIVFDVNETLLDMVALDVIFGKIFGGATAGELRKKWFKQVLELFLTATVIGGIAASTGSRMTRCE